MLLTFNSVGCLDNEDAVGMYGQSKYYSVGSDRRSITAHSVQSNACDSLVCSER